MNLRLSEEARDDLRAIYAYLSERSPQSAARVVGTILKAASGLTMLPLMGRQGEVEGTRERVVARYPYIIVYVLEEDMVVVARILHGALDTVPLVESEPAAMPTLGHGLIASRLQRALGDFVEEQGLGYVFSAQTSFRVGAEPKEPDLAYVSKGRLSGLPADLDVDADFAPDLAVEIASRSDTLATISRKVRAYIDVGVQAVWVVNPWLRTVEVYRANGQPVLLSESESLRGDPVVPGFSVDLARIFPS